MCPAEMDKSCFPQALMALPGAPQPALDPLKELCWSSSAYQASDLGEDKGGGGGGGLEKGLSSISDGSGEMQDWAELGF